jgi:uncharacterized repeat protein (TIGR01451 family)
MKKSPCCRRSRVLYAAMFAVWFGVGVLLVPVATTKRSMAPAWAGEGSAFPKAQSPLVHTAPLLTQPDPAVRGLVMTSYGKLPLSFERNQGQTDGRVKFLSRGSGYTLYLTAKEAVLALQKTPSKGENQNAKIRNAGLATDQLPRTSTVLRMRLEGANSAPKVRGLEQLPGKSNYFIGNDPTKWHTHVPNYARVQYEGIYPGVDLVYYGHQRQLEYDFVVAPGANPKSIRLAFEGAGQMKVGTEGDLVLSGEGGELRFQKPVVYQLTGGRDRTQTSEGVRTFIDGRYLLEGKSQVSFYLAAYDRSKPLVIDPVLSYSTYLGGSGDDWAFGIALDLAGNAYVTGFTNSTNFPTKGAFQGANAGGYDAFVTKLSPTGSALVYSTYLGGGGADQAYGIALDSAGNAYVTGLTNSTNFPTKNAFQGANAGGGDVFVTKLGPTGSALVYSTYLGGSGADYGYGIALDSARNAYVTGLTSSTNFPTKNSFQGANAGNSDAFVTKLSPTGSALVYSTYLGGSDNDQASGITLDSAGNAYVTGRTYSTNFPTKNPFQGANAGGYDAFVTKLSPIGSTLVYSTYLGGSGDDEATGIALDSARNAYVTGRTVSTNFPTQNPFQAANAGGTDAFVTKLAPIGSALVYSTYLGGNGDDLPYGIALDLAGNAYVTGLTNSTNFPTHIPFQGANAGRYDAFVSKIMLAADLEIANNAPSSVASGSILTYTIQVTNLGPDTASKVTIKDLVPAGTTFNSVGVSSGSCTSPGPGGSGVVVCTLLSLDKAASVTETLMVNVTAASGIKITDTTSVSSSTFDPNKANNSAKATTTVM